jgi:acyl carrier protein
MELEPLKIVARDEDNTWFPVVFSGCEIPYHAKYQEETMSTQTDISSEITKEWLALQGFIPEGNFDENAPLALDSFSYLSFTLYAEDRLSVEIKAHEFFGEDAFDETETYASLCDRLRRSI